MKIVNIYTAINILEEKLEDRCKLCNITNNLCISQSEYFNLSGGTVYLRYSKGCYVWNDGKTFLYETPCVVFSNINAKKPGKKWITSLLDDLKNEKYTIIFENVVNARFVDFLTERGFTIQDNLSIENVGYSYNVYSYILLNKKATLVYTK